MSAILAWVAHQLNANDIVLRRSQIVQKTFVGHKVKRLRNFSTKYELRHPAKLPDFKSLFPYLTTILKSILEIILIISILIQKIISILSILI